MQASEIRKWGFVQVGPLKEGIRVARANLLWGLLGPTGEEILPLEFELIREKRGVFQVMSGGETGYFHPEGRWVLPLDKLEK